MAQGFQHREVPLPQPDEPSFSACCWLLMAFWTFDITHCRGPPPDRTLTFFDICNIFRQKCRWWSKMSPSSRKMSPFVEKCCCLSKNATVCRKMPKMSPFVEKCCSLSNVEIYVEKCRRLLKNVAVCRKMLKNVHCHLPPPKKKILGGIQNF